MKEKLMKELEIKRDEVYEEIMKEMTDKELYRWKRVLWDRNELKVKAQRTEMGDPDFDRYMEAYRAIERTMIMVLKDELEHKVLRYNLYDWFYGILDDERGEGVKIEVENGTDVLDNFYNITTITCSDGRIYKYTGNTLRLTEYDKDGNVKHYISC